MAKQIDPRSAKKHIHKGDSILFVENYPHGAQIHKGIVYSVRILDDNILYLVMDDGRVIVKELQDDTPFLEYVLLYLLGPDETVKIGFETPKTIPVLPNQTTIEEQIAENIHPDAHLQGQ